MTFTLANIPARVASSGWQADPAPKHCGYPERCGVNGLDFASKNWPDSIDLDFDGLSRLEGIERFFRIGKSTKIGSSCCK